MQGCKHRIITRGSNSRTLYCGSKSS